MDANTILLNEHLAKEEQAVRYGEAVESRADFLLEEGHEFYPLDKCNFSEVLAELKDEQVEVLAKWLKLAKSQDFNDTMQNEMVARMLWIYAEHYMRKYAERQSEKEVYNG